MQINTNQLTSFQNMAADVNSTVIYIRYIQISVMELTLFIFCQRGHRRVIQVMERRAHYTWERLQMKQFQEIAVRTVND